MPADPRSQRYRDNAAECMKQAHAVENERRRAVLLQLAQSWLEMATGGFRVTGRNRRFDTALAGDNDGQLPNR
jgi:hypothetical protein